MGNDRSNIYLDARNIEANGRAWLENVLGRPLADDEQVYIMAFEPGVAADDASKHAAFDRIEAILDKAHRNAEEQGITAEEADAAVEEAIEYVRRHR